VSAAEIVVERAEDVLTVTFNRPRQRNAMIWAMYEGLYQACEQADSGDGLRVMVLRGAGDRGSTRWLARSSRSCAGTRR
jgi:enoyl-CoA hydratase/carnithine racemase